MTEASQTPLRPQAIGAMDMGDEIDIWALFQTIWRGKWWISITTIIAILIGGYYAYRVAVPMYTARASVALQQRDQQVVDLTNVISGLSGDQATINTEVEVLRSRNLATKLVRKLDLVSDPEFNGRLRVIDPYSVDGLKIQLRELILGPIVATTPSDQEVLDATVDNLLRVVSISNVRQSYVFQITALTTSAKKSALLANTLSKLYILDQLEVKFEATEQATNWLTDRVGELKDQLEISEAKSKEFDAGSKLVSPEALAALRRQLKETRDRFIGVSEEQAVFAARLSELNNATAQAPDRRAKLAEDRTLDRIASLISAGDAAALQTFDLRYQQILQRAALEQTRAKSQVDALRLAITTMEAQIENQSIDLVTLQQLQREAEANRLIYEFFLSRLKETSVQQGIQQADSRVLSQAVVPTSASAPRRSLILALSAMLGLFVGTALILLQEMLQNTFRTSEELEAYTGYTVMGQIPKMPVRNRKKILEYAKNKPSSQAVEAVRNLRTSILLSNVDNPPKVVMVTSTLPAEGKTTESLLLAQNMAAIGKKVLLIEGDIRRRVFAQYFDVPNDQGLVSVLAGEVKFSDAVYWEETLGLDILVGEKPSINAADLFSSEKFESFLQDARKAYDMIVIDTPPALVVPDARVIGQFADAIMYVVRWDQTPKTQLRQGLAMFESVGLKVTGLILGQIDPKGMKRYGYGRYGAYGYGAKGYYEN